MSVATDTIQLAAQGDRVAQQAIYESLRERGYRTAYRLVGRNDAEDVLQEAFITVFKKLESFRFESNFATWFHRIVVNCGLNHLRKAKRVPHPLRDETKIVGREPNVLPEEQELFETAMSKLDAELRVILELKEFQQLPYAEIATILEIPEGTVGSRLNRARRELRSAMVQLGWSDVR